MDKMTKMLPDSIEFKNARSWFNTQGPGTVLMASTHLTPASVRENWDRLFRETFGAQVVRSWDRRTYGNIKYIQFDNKNDALLFTMKWSSKWES